jgi:flagellar hook-length control protein FliK
MLARWGTADQLGDSITAWYATSRNEANARLEVQLNPPELGRVVVRLEKARGKVAAKLLVSNDGARIAIERELPTIHQSLEEAGINLDEFDVAQHGNHQREERPHDETFRTLRWSKGESPDTSSATPGQMGETTAGRVDLRV